MRTSLSFIAPFAKGFSPGAPVDGTRRRSIEETWLVPGDMSPLWRAIEDLRAV